MAHTKAGEDFREPTRCYQGTGRMDVHAGVELHEIDAANFGMGGDDAGGGKEIARRNSPCAGARGERHLCAIDHVDVEIDMDGAANGRQAIEFVMDETNKSPLEALAQSSDGDPCLHRLGVSPSCIREGSKANLADANAWHPVLKQGLNRVSIVQPAVGVAKIKVRIERE